MSVRMTAAQLAALGVQTKPKTPRRPQRGEEAALSRAVRQWLTARGIFWLRLNAGTVFVEGRPVNVGRAGTSDLLFVVDGHAVFCELKSPTGRQRESQRAFQKAVEAAKASYLLIRSLDELIAALGGKEDE